MINLDVVFFSFFVFFCFLFCLFFFIFFLCESIVVELFEVVFFIVFTSKVRQSRGAEVSKQ